MNGTAAARGLLLLAAVVVSLATPGEQAQVFAQNPRHNCDFCHNLHGGSFQALSDYAVIEDLCWSCHSDAGPPQVDRDGTLVDVPQGPYDVHNGPKHTSQTACWDCHNHEGEAGNNLVMIQENMPTPNSGTRSVVFTARTGLNSFADSVPPIDGVCEVCHTQTDYHRNTTGWEAGHNAQRNCVPCHTHESGFQPSGGCTACHSVSQGSRRAIVPEFNRISRHIEWTLFPAGSQSADSIPDADCQVCHDQTQHQQGNVRIWDVDDPGNTTAVTILNGDPGSSSTEAAKLDVPCLACHDADGANGNVIPFSDGVTRPPLDVTAWNTASHNQSAAIAGCYGDGVFGCHATGHGSQKRNSLSPADSGPGAGNAGEEEGFCYVCHDANGPASTDIESEFGLATRHNVSASDPGGQFVECTNCHNPHLASAANRLANPDNTSASWGGTFEDFCLTCHDGAPPAGISFPVAPRSGFDKSAFVGTTHDTQTGGSDSCRSCHRQHGSAYLALANDEYVVTDPNNYQQGNGDYQLCWTCHDENTIVRGDNAFGNLHDRHVRGDDSPCIICHEVHSPYDAGEPGLINFDNAIQMGLDIGYIDGRDGSSSFWWDSSNNRGYCYIRCHSKDHKPKNYRP